MQRIESLMLWWHRQTFVYRWLRHDHGIFHALWKAMASKILGRGTYISPTRWGIPPARRCN